MVSDKIFSKIRNIKFVYLICIIGAAVMLFASGPAKRENINKQEDKPTEEASQEERLCELLSHIEGVGKPSVMITYFSTQEKALAYEIKTDKKGETAQGAGGESFDEKAVMSDGEPVILREIYPEVKGVAVACEGAHNPDVKQKVYDAVSVLLGVAMHRICVLPKAIE